MRAWDTKDDTSRGVAAILDVVNIVQQNEKVDPENKLLILSRYSLFHFISVVFIGNSPQYSWNMSIYREQIVRSTMRLNVFLNVDFGIKTPFLFHVATHKFLKTFK